MKVKIKLTNGHEIRIEKDYLTPNRLRDLISEAYSKCLDESIKEFIQERKQELFKRRES